MISFVIHLLAGLNSCVMAANPELHWKWGVLENWHPCGKRVLEHWKRMALEQ